MEQQFKTFYVGYRGYVRFLTPIQALSEEDAFNLINSGDIPDTPIKGQELILASADFDLELDYDHVDSKIDWRSEVPKPLEKQMIKAAIAQTDIRAEKQKQANINHIQAQIDNANQQLLTATKSVTDTIEKLTAQLTELTKD
jgi:hypothetical protein